jgi:alpha-N-arabinofuranosidase
MQTVGTPENGLTQIYTLTDALALAGWLNVFLRHTESVTIACLAQSVNVISPLLVGPQSVLRQTIFAPLKLYSDVVRGGVSVRAEVNGGKGGERYEGETLPKWMGEVPASDGKGLEALDVAAVLHPSTSENGDGKRKLVLAVINRTQEDIFAKIRIAFGKVVSEEAEVWEVWDEDLLATNTWEAGERVKAVRSVEQVSEWNKEGRVWKRHGVCLVVLDVVLDG